MRDTYMRPLFNAPNAADFHSLYVCMHRPTDIPNSVQMRRIGFLTQRRWTGNSAKALTEQKQEIVPILVISRGVLILGSTRFAISLDPILLVHPMSDPGFGALERFRHCHVGCRSVFEFTWWCRLFTSEFLWRVRLLPFY